MPEQLADFKVAEAARYFGVCVPTIWNWIHAGKLSAYRLGGNGPYRIQAETIHAFVKRSKEVAK